MKNDWKKGDVPFVVVLRPIDEMADKWVVERWRIESISKGDVQHSAKGYHFQDGGLRFASGLFETRESAEYIANTKTLSAI